MENEFLPRLTKPTTGNKYYICKANGGYSDAIQGSPVDKECNVLSNCVGYAYGRFNEIGGYGACKYLAPVNAENFMQYKGNLETGTTPKIGACMVWQKGATLQASDGAGHVAIVEKVISDTEVVTSESAWGGSAFYTKTRKKGNGDWDEAGKRFLGFIYNPAECCQKEKENFNVGDIVEFVGKTHYLNAMIEKGSACTSGKAVITAISNGKKHPYHLKGSSFDGDVEGSNVWGWVDEEYVKPYKEKINVEQNINLLINAAYLDELCINWNEPPMMLSSKCLVQEWKDGKNRYPELTKLAQKLLGMSETGICDAKMTKAIKEYQTKCGLFADGGIGKGTWEFLLGVKQWQ